MVISILDVIDNFWGRDPIATIQHADSAAIARFGEEVNRFYDAFVTPLPPRAELRTYYGGLVAANPSLAGKQQTFFNNLLYTHSTIIPDPVGRWFFDRYEELAKTPPAEYLNVPASADQSEWIGWMFSSYRAFKWDLQICRDVLTFFIRGLLPLRPLVQAGILVLISQAHTMLPLSQGVVADALADAEDPNFRELCEQHIDEFLPLWDNIRGGIMTPSSGGQCADPAVVRWAKAKEAAYYIRKNLRLAHHCGSVYIPENKTDFALLRHILTSSGNRAGYDNWEIRVAQSVGELSVPSLEGLPLQELVSIRKDEQAFEEFRLWLAGRLFHPGAEPDPQLPALTSAEIEAEIARLRRQLATSNVIKQWMKENGLIIAVEAFLGAASTGKMEGAFAGGAVAALAGILSSLLIRDGKTGGVLAKLARMNRVAPNATLGKEGKVPGLPSALAKPFFGEIRNGPKPDHPPSYTPEFLQKIVESSLKPNTTGKPFKAVRG